MRLSPPDAHPPWLRPLCLAACIIAGALPAWADGSASETVFTYRGADSARDNRNQYQVEALRLALEKTRKTFGPYRLVASPAMAGPRALAMLNNNQLPNFFVELSYDEAHLEASNVAYIPFPVDRGIVGYRVCFASPQTKALLAKTQNLDGLRAFRYGLGTGWADVKIFRHNGFQVVEGVSYEGLFQMLSMKRFDLFCRGANEIREEWEAHRDVPGLDYDETLSIAYALPRFYFYNKGNRAAAERVDKGLQLAFQDGSLQALWRKHYRASLDFVKLKERRIFWLENPLIKGLDTEAYRKFLYDPLTETDLDRKTRK